jgi:hypothetical protein
MFRSRCEVDVPCPVYLLPCPLQIPHYNLEAATEAVKPVMGPYYREPVKSPGLFPTHLIEPLIRSFSHDHFVAETGNIVFYQVILRSLACDLPPPPSCPAAAMLRCCYSLSLPAVILAPHCV